jgi:hypothetical protein
LEGGSVGGVGACMGMGVSAGESGAACWRMVGWVYMGLPLQSIFGARIMGQGAGLGPRGVSLGRSASW